MKRAAAERIVRTEGVGLAIGGVATEDSQVNLLEAFFLRCLLMLHDAAFHGEPQRQAREYLQSRGFDLKRLERVPVGLFPDRAQVKQGLLEAGCSTAEIERAKVLADVRLRGRLVGPIRDAQGKIVCFWARDPLRRTRMDLYLRRDWTRLAPVFGLDVALPALSNRRDPLLLIEDQVDALWFHARGMHHVAAVCGPIHEMTAARWTQLATAGVRRVVLFAHRHWSEADGMWTAIDALFDAAPAPSVYVLPHASLRGAHHAHELLWLVGPDRFRQILEREVLPVGQYKARSIRLPCWSVDCKRSFPPLRRRKPQPVVPPEFSAAVPQEPETLLPMRRLRMRLPLEPVMPVVPVQVREVPPPRVVPLRLDSQSILVSGHPHSAVESAVAVCKPLGMVTPGPRTIVRNGAGEVPFECRPRPTIHPPTRRPPVNVSPQPLAATPTRLRGFHEGCDHHHCGEYWCFCFD